MASITSQLILRLLDKVSGPARQVRGALDGVTGAARRLLNSQTMAGRFRNALEDNNKALDRARSKMGDAVASAVALGGALGYPIKAAMEFETTLEDIGQKVGFGAERFDEFGKKLREMARDTTRDSQEVAEGFDVLAGLGASEEQADKIMAINGRAATAYRAQLTDLNRAGWAAVDNLKVPLSVYERAMVGIAQTGKDGAFEIKDMATYLPRLTAIYAGLGQSGKGALLEIASAAQIAFKGTGDAGSAATQLGDLMRKMNATTTISAFKKMGVDLERELKKAAEAGLTPLEAIKTITERTLNGDMSKLGHLFTDAEAQGGMRSLIQNWGQFEEIQKRAMAASDTVQTDYARRLETSAGATSGLWVEIKNLAKGIGGALLPAVGDLSEKFTPFVKAAGEFVDNNKGLVQAVLLGGGALIALSVSAKAAHYGFLLMKGGILSVLTPLVALPGLLKTAAASNIAFQTAMAGSAGVTLGPLGKLRAGFAGIAGLIPGLMPLVGVFKAVGAAVLGLTWPVAAVIAAIVGAGILIYKYWEPIKAFFGAFFGAIGAALAPIGEALSSAFKPITDVLGPAISSVIDWFGDLLSPITATSDTTKSWAEAGVAAGEAVGNAIKSVIDFWQRLFRIVGAVITKVSEFVSLGGAVEAVGGFFSRLGGGGAKPAAPKVAAKRALGGNVKRGLDYEVGEKGREIFSPNQNGRIIPSSRVADYLAGAGAGRGAAANDAHKVEINAPITISGAGDPETVATKVADKLGGAVERALRSANADLGVA